MNVAIDIEPLASKSKYRGIGVYTNGLLKKMFSLDKENNYFLFNMYEDIDVKKMLPINHNVSYEHFYMGKDFCLLPQMSLAMQDFNEKNIDVIGGLYKKFIENNNIDTFFLTATLDTLCYYKKEWFKNINLGVIAYDIIPLLFSDEYIKGKGGRQYLMATLELWKSADVILAISQSVKEDLVKYLAIEESKIKVVYPGIDAKSLNKEYLEEQYAEVLGKFNITKDFLLFPGADDYRKNVAATIEAFDITQAKESYQLVVTGYYTNDEFNKIRNLVKEKNLEEKIILTNYISNEELNLLYKKAKLLVFPSLYEGFGLPVAEAFACGLNVLTSNNSSLGEIGKDAGLLVDPYSKKSIAQGIDDALSNTDFTQFNEKIKEKLRQFDWEISAKAALQAIDLPKKETSKANEKQKLAYFAPLDTKNTILKKCYFHMLKVLSKKFDVSIFVKNPDAIGLDTGFPLYNAKKFAAYSGNYEQIVYQMANLEENMYMLSTVMQFSGTVILHDLNIHTAVYEHYIEQNNNVRDYEIILSKEIKNHQQIAEKIRKDKTIGKKVAKELDIINCVINNAKHIVVCDEFFKEKLLKHNIDCDVWVLMPYGYEKECVETQKTIAILGNAVHLEEVQCIINALVKLGDKEITLVFLHLQQLENEMQTAFTKAGLKFKFLRDITEGEGERILGNSFMVIKLKEPTFALRPGDFYRALSNCQNLITFDDTVNEKNKDECYEILTYEDKSYHLRNYMEKIINEEDYILGVKKSLCQLFNLKKIEENLNAIVEKPQNNVVTQEVLEDVYSQILLYNTTNIDEEIKKVANTLAYIKENKSDDTLINEENKINSKKIIQNIHSELKKSGIDVLKGNR